ncbi:hypothetical protein B0J13DRAFT_649955 [Dactylonectria estremocensis]|uniref:Uncharacterized protein n=1 Tax=Dactylonectria estremocensis TaxID=1079267 RepID=A0A9P9FCE0_9HYPO|nr:hypothetical protein B0J13DRAFT_649955 [Dactylonectria estremocensis]
MAEPKTKAINGNGNHSSEKTPTEQSKLWQMLALAKEVAKDVDAIRDYEKTVEGRRALEIELENRNSESQRLREVNAKVLREFADHKAQANAKKETLFIEFEQKFKTYESNKTAVETMAQEVADMKEKLDAAETSQKSKATEVNKLKQQLKAAETNAKSQAAEIKEMNADCEMHRSRMQTSISERDACMTKLSLANRDLGEDLLHDYGAEGLRKLGLDLKALSKKCHAFVLEYFNDAEGAKDSASEIQELKARFPKIPLTTLTSRPAAQMRCAAAEAVIADIMTAQIFVPFYLGGDLRTAASTLLPLFGDDERRRTVYRCQILRTTSDAEEATRVQEEIVRKASNEVRSTLHPLVAAFRQGSFYNAVPNLFREALALWADVQRSRDLITADTPDVNEVQPPSKYDEYDQTGDARARSPKGSKGAKPSIAAVLFPQVATREDLIFNGMVLWSNQGAVTAAMHETTASATNGGANGEPMKHANRRRSDASPRYNN